MLSVLLIKLHEQSLYRKKYAGTVDALPRSGFAHPCCIRDTKCNHDG
jgi:hypothetical protein